MLKISKVTISLLVVVVGIYGIFSNQTMIINFEMIGLGLLLIVNGFEARQKDKKRDDLYFFALALFLLIVTFLRIFL